MGVLIVAPASRRLSWGRPRLAVTARPGHDSRRSLPGAKSKGRRRYVYATVFLFMATRPDNPLPDSEPGSLYCPNCAEEVTDPLTCGDCSSVICRRCGTALESSDELGIG
jgi:hypothetical protein